MSSVGKTVSMTVGFVSAHAAPAAKAAAMSVMM